MARPDKKMPKVSGNTDETEFRGSFTFHLAFAGANIRSGNADSDVGKQLAESSASATR